MADATIREQYARVAKQSGLASSSTMEDQLIRHHETGAIAKFVGLTTGDSGRVADFGCGNGYTLGVLAERYPNLLLSGFEFTPELLDLATERFGGIPHVSAQSADVREAGFWGPDLFDAASRCTPIAASASIRHCVPSTPLRVSSRCRIRATALFPSGDRWPPGARRF